jgi:hypothetical protein
MRSVFIITILVSFIWAGIMFRQISADEASDSKSVFEKKCSSCHSLGKITSKKKTAGKWEKIVNSMKVLAEKEEKNRISSEEEKIIADYLAKEYGK